ncbi:MAG: DUF4013 domain-containing protein [Verrucomicrobiales bacterium]|nr:DUF4013 domain-containing protein [Verrucomicrobiales bacterium]
MEAVIEEPPMKTDLTEANAPSRFPIWKRFFRWVAIVTRSIFGFFTIVVCLALVSVVPVLNLLSLGYLLEASARVAREGKLRYGLIGLSQFARLGTIAIGIWLWVLPLRLLYSFWQDAELIKAGSQQADQLRLFLSFSIIVISLHLIWAILRGGKLRHFLWPAPIRFFRWLSQEKNGAGLLQKVKDFFGRIHLVDLWILGAKGFAGAAIWLAIPVLLLMAAGSVANPGLSFLISLLGGILLGIVALFLPFLQTRFAVTRKFSEFFSIKEARRLFKKAPLAFWLALFVTLLFALPLYLLKIELTPNEVAWLPNLVFVLFIFPARLIVGWALSRALRRDTNRIWVSRWTARLAALPVVAAYVFLVWLTQYLSWHGSFSLMEQHAFLVPAPLLGL